MAESSKNRSRLGRGLSSLISLSSSLDIDSAPAEEATSADDAAGPGATKQPVSRAIPESAVERLADAKAPASAGGGAGAVEEIPLASISPNPHQPRRSFDEAGLSELAASMKANGVIQPVVVRPVPAVPGDPHAFELIAGERRFRAAQLAGLSTIPVVVRNVDSLTQAQLALVENIQREDLNPIDRAQGYRMLIDQLGLTQAELAGRLGEDRSGIANYLRLLDLAPAVQELVRVGRLSVGHAKLLAGVPDVAEQQRLANLVVSQELSVRNLERLLSGAAPVTAPSRSPQASPHVQDLEKSLARQLGMRVQLRAMTKGRGRLTIHYASLDQFDELLGRLGVSAE